MARKPSSASSNFESLFGVKSGEGLVSGLKLISPERISTGSQPRTHFNAEEISELAHSISELRGRGEGIEGTGILQPLLVTSESGGTYRLIAGERRLRASKDAKLNEVPVLEVSSRSDTLLAVQLIENLQRRDLAPLEEAYAFQRLRDEQGLSIRDLAAFLGKTRGYITNRLDLLKMGQDVQEMVSVRTDTLLHAREIDSVTDAGLRQELIQGVLSGELSRAAIRIRINPSSEEVSVQTDTLDNPASNIDSNLAEATTASSNSANRKEKPISLKAALSAVLATERAVKGNMVLDSDTQKSLRAELSQLRKSLDRLEKLLLR